MFRIRFYVEETAILPKPLLGTVVFRQRVRSRSMERLGGEGGTSEAAQEPVAVAVPLSKSADTVENEGKSGTESVVFFSGNPEIDVIKGVLRLFKDNK